jgi:coenzyme Q-binding protein COQ10
MVVNKRIKNEIFADMYVRYKFILSQKFGSHIKFDKEKLTIETNYIEGPLKDLTTNWKFESIESKKSKIIFNVNFEFKNFIHQKIAETFYPLIENKMIDSFKERAKNTLD